MIAPALLLKFGAVIIISYLLGSLNFSIIFSKAVAKKDIRESGSGNAGATNMLRTYGKRFAVVTMLGDILKVVLAIVITFAVLNVPMRYLFGIPSDADEIQRIMLYKEFAGFFCEPVAVIYIVNLFLCRLDCAENTGGYHQIFYKQCLV